jgi:hypothetical protein
MSDVTGAIEKIESAKNYKQTPKGWAKRWAAEMVAADKRVKRWHKQGHRIQARYQDRRGDEAHEGLADANKNSYRVNLFHSNTKTLRDMLYGNPPKTDVSRRYADAEDDSARVASTIIQRMLNTSVESSGDDTKSTLGFCLDDRLLPGLGVARVRYDYDSEKEEIPPLLGESGEELAEGYTQETISDERAPVDYVHWDDFRWGWARTWAEVPWIAFRSFIDKDRATDRFGKEKAGKLQYKNKSIPEEAKERLNSDDATDAWDRAEVWEIWNKKTKQVFWWSKGCDEVLDEMEDPLNLYGFWPCPEPMLANCTTSLLLPQPDFAIAQDLYNEIDALETRIGIITTAVRVVGVYDQSAEGIKRMLTEGFENELIPVENWSAFAEGKGLDGKIDWMPVGEIVAALDKLVAMRGDAMSLLYEVTGMSEIMRGANGPDRETADAAGSKRQFASVRVQGLQEDFSRFASDLMALRAEIISKHFSPETIVRQSNIASTPDAEFIPQAIQVIKTPQDSMWKIKIEPETLAMMDYARLKRERADFIQGLAQFLQAAMPLAEMDPNAIGPLLIMLKWSMAGFKGSNEIEGVLDKAIDQMQKAGQQEKPEEPDPAQLKMEADKQKHQNSMQLEATKHQNAMQAIQAKAQFDIEELKAELQKELTVIREETQAEIQREVAQAKAAMMQDDHETRNTMKVDDNKPRPSNATRSGEGQ